MTAPATDLLKWLVCASLSDKILMIDPEEPQDSARSPFRERYKEFVAVAMHEDIDIEKIERLFEEWNLFLDNHGDVLSRNRSLENFSKEEFSGTGFDKLQ